MILGQKDVWALQKKHGRRVNNWLRKILPDIMSITKKEQRRYISHQCMCWRESGLTHLNKTSMKRHGHHLEISMKHMIRVQIIYRQKKLGKPLQEALQSKDNIRSSDQLRAEGQTVVSMRSWFIRRPAHSDMQHLKLNTCIVQSLV